MVCEFNIISVELNWRIQIKATLTSPSKLHAKGMVLKVYPSYDYIAYV